MTEAKLENKTDGKFASFEDMVDHVLAQARSVMLDRQAKYGPNNVTRHGLLGVAVRLSDKLARLDHLVFEGQGAEAIDESAEDTLIDVIGYAIIGLCLYRKWWTREQCPPLALRSTSTEYTPKLP